MKSRRVEILVAAVVLFISASPVMASIHFNDGGVWNIDYEINDRVEVDYGSPGMGTTVNILEGANISGFHSVIGWEDSIINMLGGSISLELAAIGSSEVTVSGGSFARQSLLEDNAVLTIDGSDFAVDGTDVGYVELSSILGGSYSAESYRRLTGTLLNGDPLDNDFRIGSSARIVLVPEPGTLLLLGFGGLVGVRIRKRA